jgi:hypothetical protein
MRKRFLALLTLVAAMTLVTAWPASASVVWDGSATNGTSVFASVLCDSPSSLTVENWGGSNTPVFGFNKADGSERCEGHSIRVGGSEYQFTGNNPSAYWFGWQSRTTTGNTGTVFQWKSNGTNDKNDQNYPVLMKVEDSQLKIWYVSPGETWHAAGSIAWSVDTWHKIQLGINARSGSAGSFQLYVDGQLVADQSGVQTWDVLGNKPRWGTYEGPDDIGATRNIIYGLKMGTSRADVD